MKRQAALLVLAGLGLAVFGILLWWDAEEAPEVRTPPPAPRSSEAVNRPAEESPAIRAEPFREPDRPGLSPEKPTEPRSNLETAINALWPEGQELSRPDPGNGTGDLHPAPISRAPGKGTSDTRAIQPAHHRRVGQSFSPA